MKTFSVISQTSSKLVPRPSQDTSMASSSTSRWAATVGKIATNGSLGSFSSRGSGQMNQVRQSANLGRYHRGITVLSFRSWDWRGS